MLSTIRSMPAFSSPSTSNADGSNSPLASRVNTSTPTARTRGSAYGSLISAPSTLVTIARAAATIVAVAPTLEARSHVSPSNLPVRSTEFLPSIWLLAI